MKKRTCIAIALLGAPLVVAVQCVDPGKPEAEPNNTLSEAYFNTDHPVLRPDVFAVYGNLTETDLVDYWWILPKDTTALRMREVDVEKTPSPFLADKKKHRLAKQGVKRLVFSREKYDKVATKSRLKTRFNLESFLLPDDTMVTLELEPTDVFSEDVKIVAASTVDDVYTERDLPKPEVLTFAGRVKDQPNSLAALAITPDGQSFGFIQCNNQSLVLTMEPTPEGEAPILCDLYQLPSELLPPIEPFCEFLEAEGFAPPPGGAGGLAGAGTTQPPYRRIRLALDSDFELTQYYGSAPGANYYMVVLLSMVNAIYKRDLNLEFELCYLRSWENSGDPWNRNSTSAQLDQFRAHWESQMSSVDRDLAHLLTKRFQGAGIAWLNALCTGPNGVAYGLSGVYGGFPYPEPEEDSPWNWDIFVLAHELGHNLGALHTHMYCPPIDQCAPTQYAGDCQNSQVCNDHGTIMSYCYFCDGFMANIDLRFHEGIQENILNYLDSISCDFRATQPRAVLGGVLVREGAEMTASLYRIAWEDDTDSPWYPVLVESYDLFVPPGTPDQIFNVSFEFDENVPHVYEFTGTPQNYYFSLYFEE